VLAAIRIADPLRADMRADGPSVDGPSTREVVYLSMRPAEAEITGAGLEWTVSMISLLSMPCR